MKKFFTLLYFVLSTMAISAQHTPQAVVPGSKGELPKTPVVAPARDGELNCLTLQAVYFDQSYAQANEAWLSFPSPHELGATSYTLEYRQHDGGSWSSRPNYISEYGSMTDFPMPYANTDFRLIVMDGPYEGYYTNVVNATSGSGPNTVLNSWSEAEQMFKMMGEAVGSTFQYAITVKTGSGATVNYDENSGYYTYQWYRENPNNGDRVAIEGANARTYTPVIDDCGYCVVLEVKGDGQHCNFTLLHNFGEVYLPVAASIEYIGSDGFVLNTDYVIPNYENAFQKNDIYNGSTGGFVPVAGVTERKPGQYVFREAIENYNGYEYDLQDNGTKLTFIYMRTWEEPPSPWYREAQVMAERYWASLNVKAFYQTRPIPVAAINVYGYNIDGKLVFVKGGTQTGTTETDGVTIYPDYENPRGNLYFNNKYIVKVIGMNQFGTTYYPSTLKWEEAQEVTLNDDGSLKEIEVQMQNLAPITGEYTISGQINAGNEGAKASRRAEGDAEETYTVLLQVHHVLNAPQQGNDIIAQTESDTQGHYSFTNVPAGTYDILVNIAGCTMTQPIAVTVDANNPTVDNVDYNVSGGEVKPAGILQVSAGSTAANQTYYDLNGRQLLAPQRGLNIVRSNGKVMKVTLK